MLKTPEEKRAAKIEAIALRFRGNDLRKAIKEVAGAFQKLRRLQERDENGICQCITCGARYKWNDLKLNAGHYISRRHAATVLDPMNVWPQCARCNDHGHGEGAKYRAFLEANYPGEADRLEGLARTVRKFTPHELAELLIDIRVELKEIV